MSTLFLTACFYYALNIQGERTNTMTNNQDTVMENIMLFSPMPVLQAIQESYLESILADMHAEDAEIFGESVPVHKSGKSRKQRRAARRVQNKRHHHSDRMHGKKRMPSAKFVREANNHQQDIYHAHAKYVWHENRKGEWIPRTVRKHDKFRQERFMRSAEITEVERLTASVLAHMSNHVFMWDEQVVWDLTEALCEEYRQVFPDDSYICVYGKHVYLYMQYMDGSIMVDERRYTLR